MIAENKHPDHRSLRVRDLAGREGADLQSPDDRLSSDDVLIEGEFLHRELRRGLFLHVGDVAEERPFTITSVLPEGLSCIFFLEGRVDLTLGDRPFSFARHPRSELEGTAIMSARPEFFRRASHGSQRVRHLVVSVTPEWLETSGLKTLGGARSSRLSRNHLLDHRWRLTRRTDELVRQAMAPSAFAPELRNLYLEGRAVEIVAESLSAMLEGDQGDDDSRLLTSRDLACLRRAREYVAAHLGEALSVEQVAREAGISVSGLQRLFRVSQKASVFEYIRRERLGHARAALQSGQADVGEASLLAGYLHPANFATAFKREFGTAPSDFTQRRSRRRSLA